MRNSSSNDQDRHLTVQMFVTLLFLFLSFVILDVVTTEWLLQHDPQGIVNEANPIGVLLFTSFGHAGVIFPKFALFILFAALTMHFTHHYAQIRWFVETTETLVLIMIALSLVATFNNFIAILGILYVKGIWPLIAISREQALLGLFAGDLGLGAAFANGTLYIWGLTRRTLHLRVFLGLFLFLAPVLLFHEGFRVFVWAFALYVASASLALGLGSYISHVGHATRARTETRP